MKKRSSTERPVSENLERGPAMLNDIAHHSLGRHRPRVDDDRHLADTCAEAPAVRAPVHEWSEPGSFRSLRVCIDVSWVGGYPAAAAVKHDDEAAPS